MSFIRLVFPLPLFPKKTHNSGCSCNSAFLKDRKFSSLNWVIDVCGTLMFFQYKSFLVFVNTGNRAASAIYVFSFLPSGYFHFGNNHLSILCSAFRKLIHCMDYRRLTALTPNSPLISRGRRVSRRAARRQFSFCKSPIFLKLDCITSCIF